MVSCGMESWEMYLVQAIELLKRFAKEDSTPQLRKQSKAAFRSRVWTLRLI